MEDLGRGEPAASGLLEAAATAESGPVQGRRGLSRNRVRSRPAVWRRGAVGVFWNGQSVPQRPFYLRLYGLAAGFRRRNHVVLDLAGGKRHSTAEGRSA